MRVIFAGGGTGGHLYPALSIARAMQQEDPSVDPFFIGARRGIERTVLPESGYPFELLDLHPLYRARPWENAKTMRGALSAWRRIGSIARAKPPACVVGTGGYAAGVALAYAARHGIPYVLQEQNSFPGLTTRFFSRWARQIHVGFPEAATALPKGDVAKRISDSGNPITPPPDARPDKSSIRRDWGFPPGGGAVLLIFGGSQGSLALNEVVARWVARGLPAGLFVIWATGRGTYADYASLDSDRVRVREYISPMASAYAASDFALARGGAISTAELCAWGIPSILVPLPTAAADHQTANARALAAAGAAEVIVQRELTVERLDAAVRAFLEDPALLASRATAALARARPHAARDIARAILEMIREQAA